MTCTSFAIDRIVKKVVVLGAGSAGLLTALALRKRHADLPVVILRSKEIPVIGVGEGSTWPVTAFLHDFLQINTAKFFEIAKPTWKLGIRFNWGSRGTFYYPFHNSADTVLTGIDRPIGCFVGDQLNYADPCSALMAHGCAFARGSNGAPDMAGRHFAYHFENEHFVSYLEQLAAASGITTVEGKVVDVKFSGQLVSGLQLASGRIETADLFVDCSGFVSQLLGKALKEPFVSFKSTLYCDRAVVGGWAREDEIIKPYTTAQTMDAGWAWQIEHEQRINRGYVYCADFLADDDAELEFRLKNPKVKQTRIVRFTTGRYTRTWVGNVVGIGNSASFVEPLEATALGAICMQGQLLAESLQESDRRLIDSHATLYNQRVSRNVDSIRRFLAIHYKFNTLLDTPFWRQCRQSIDLAGAEQAVEYYQQTGPALYWMNAALDLFDFATATGYLQLLVGQNVPFHSKVSLTSAQWQLIHKYLAENRRLGETGYTVQQMLQLGRDPRNRWN